MDDPRCTKGGCWLCLLVICILAVVIPAHCHGAAAGATTLSIEAIQDLRTTVDELKEFSKAEKKVIDGIHHSVAVNADTISRLEETLQVLKDEVKQFKQEQTAPLKAENAHFEAIFDQSQVNPGLIKFKPSYITTFGSKDGEQRELSANCGSSKWKEDPSTGRCYYTGSDDYQTWFNASERCQMEGGQLVSIGSPEEQNFINGMLQDSINFTAAWSGGRRFRRGLWALFTRTPWEWSDGSLFEFTNWAPNEPNNKDYEGHFEGCIQIRRGGQWNDLNCDRRWYLRPFCEKPGIIFSDGVFTAPMSGVYELSFTAWTTVTRSIVVLRNNNRIIASTSSNSVGKFGTYVVEELKVGDKVAVVLSQGAIGGQSERSAKFFGKLVQRS